MDTEMHGLTKALVKKILEHATAFDWTLQGFGMLRTYITPEIRLHIWDDRYKVDNVSTLHTHPWHFHSDVIAGVVEQYRYSVLPNENDKDTWVQGEILCGEGGGETGKKDLVRLLREGREVYLAGESYRQSAHEIHDSQPVNGTVTIIRREFLDDADHAFVYYREADGWVTAEPRMATDDEVLEICGYSLERWFA